MTTLQQQTSISLFANRASTLFREAVATVASEMPAQQQIRFSYWATFYGENPDGQDDDIQLIDRKVTKLAESKRWLARCVIERGLEGLFPRSCFSVEEALAWRHETPLWFSKPGHLSGGRGIECVASDALDSYELPPHNILQQGVTDLALINGRKFTGRLYILVWNGGVWLYRDGFILLHGVPFDPTSTGYDVHVDHRGYDKDDSPIEMRLLSTLADYPQREAELAEAAHGLLPVFRELLEASSETRYVMLGVDFLLQHKGGVQFIEVNCIPNFIHSPAINAELNVPFFSDALRLMVGLPAAGLMQLSQ